MHRQLCKDLYGLRVALDIIFYTGQVLTGYGWEGDWFCVLSERREQ